LIIDLKCNDLINVGDQKGYGNQAIVNRKFFEGTRQGANKCKPVAIRNVTGNVESHGKTGSKNTHDHEAHETDFVEVFRIEKEVRDAQVFTKVTGNHGKKNKPAKNEYMISSEVIQQ